MSSACRGSIGAIPPVWRCPRRGPSSTVHLSQRNSPRLVAVRSRFGMVRSRFGAAWRPKCRPPRRKTLTTGGHGRGSLRFGHNGAWPRLELAREPLNMRGNPFFLTPSHPHSSPAPVQGQTKSPEPVRARGACSCDWIRTSNRPVIGLVTMLPFCFLRARAGMIPTIFLPSPRLRHPSGGHARTVARQ